MNSGRSLITLSCICFVCFPDLVVKAATSTNKTTRQTVRETVLCIWTNYSYHSIGTSFLTLIDPPYLTYEIIFLTIGTWSLIPHSLWSMPSGRAFFQKNLTYLNPSVHHWNAKIFTSKYTVHFFLFYILETSCQNSWVLPLSFLECVYFYSKCQESWNILIKKNWQL